MQLIHSAAHSAAHSACSNLPTWQGYDELNTLERPLVSDVHEQEEYERAHGVSAPGAATHGGYAPPAATSGYAPPGYTPAAAYGAQPARHGGGMPAPPSQVGARGGCGSARTVRCSRACQRTAALRCLSCYKRVGCRPSWLTHTGCWPRRQPHAAAAWLGAG